MKNSQGRAFGDTERQKRRSPDAHGRDPAGRPVPDPAAARFPDRHRRPRHRRQPFQRGTGSTTSATSSTSPARSRRRSRCRTRRYPALNGSRKRRSPRRHRARSSSRRAWTACRTGERFRADPGRGWPVPAQARRHPGVGSVRPSRRRSHARRPEVENAVTAPGSAAMERHRPASRKCSTSWATSARGPVKSSWARASRRNGRLGPWRSTGQRLGVQRSWNHRHNLLRLGGNWPNKHPYSPEASLKIKLDRVSRTTA